MEMAFECKGKVKMIIGKFERCFMSQETSQKVCKQLSRTKVCFIDIYGRQSPLILFIFIGSHQYTETIIAVNHLRFTTTLLNYPLENWLVIQLTVRIGLSAKVWSCSQ